MLTVRKPLTFASAINEPTDSGVLDDPAAGLQGQ
jgi:hypothetical protein